MKMKIEGLLLDLDGVVYVGPTLIEGAVDAIRYLKGQGIPLLFATNTTTKSIGTLHQEILSRGLSVEYAELISATSTAALYLRTLGSPRCFFLLSEDAQKDFVGFEVSETNPDVVVIGDIGEQWNYTILNRVFRMLMEGAALIALHKGKFWQVEDGLRMDIGAFVSGLEYVTGKRATVLGKPEKTFFHAAVEKLGLPAARVAMVGDDIESDVGGAQASGMKGILVKTGKYREAVAAASPVEPDATIESIADLTVLF